MCVSFDWENQSCERLRKKQLDTVWGVVCCLGSSKLCISYIGNSTFSKQNIGKCLFSFSCLRILERHSLQCVKCIGVCGDIKSGKLLM